MEATPLLFLSIALMRFDLALDEQLYGNQLWQALHFKFKLKVAACAR